MFRFVLQLSWCSRTRRHCWHIPRHQLCRWRGGRSGNAGSSGGGSGHGQREPAATRRGDGNRVAAVTPVACDSHVRRVRGGRWLVHCLSTVHGGGGASHMAGRHDRVPISLVTCGTARWTARNVWTVRSTFSRIALLRSFFVSQVDSVLYSHCTYLLLIVLSAGPSGTS